MGIALRPAVLIFMRMNDWVHAIPVAWMAVVVFGSTYLVASVIYAVVIKLAAEERARAFKAVSAGLLSPIGVIFGLLVAFVAAQVWGDVDRANVAVNREASALRAVVLLAKAFPGEPEIRLRNLVTQHIRDARDSEWPAMAQHRATLAMVPAPLSNALAVAIALPANGAGQMAAQREIIASLEGALDARRQRILVSRSSVNWVKWTALALQAICTLVTIALVHADNRAAARIALGLFSTAIAVCIVLIAAHDRPFTGQLGVRPAVLLQALPDSERLTPRP